MKKVLLNRVLMLLLLVAAGGAAADVPLNTARASNDGIVVVSMPRIDNGTLRPVMQALNQVQVVSRRAGAGNAGDDTQAVSANSAESTPNQPLPVCK